LSNTAKNDSIGRDSEATLSCSNDCP